MKLIITGSQSRQEPDRDMLDFIAESGFPYYPRQRRSLAGMAAQYDADGVIVWLNEGPVLLLGNEKFFFHPSMARIRLGAYRKKGTVDPLIRACSLEPTDHFLDCTLGLGADAIVASYFAPQGRVVGVESSPGIAMVIKWGMQRYRSEFAWLGDAIHKVEVVNRPHLALLQNLPDESFDVVYFDPMFRRPLMHSQPLAPLRLLANHGALEAEAVTEACRVARKRVVMKERRDSEEFERLGFPDIVGSRHNPICFGCIHIA